MILRARTREVPIVPIVPTQFAYQVRDLAEVVVGSEEVEPNEGWNYSGVLRNLADNPNASAVDLGRSVVAEYIKFYRKRSDEWPAATR